MVEYHANGRAAGGPAREAGAPLRFTKKVTSLVGAARERGVAPDSPEAAQVVSRVLEGADATRRSYVGERLRAGVDSQADRYHELLAVINESRPARPAPRTWSG